MKWVIEKIKAMLWSVFGNNDDPHPPVDYLSGYPHWVRYFMWYVIRNPLHNFTHYLIGMKGRKHLVMWGEVFHPKGGWIIILPYVSYYGKRWAFYLGWRPEEGVFGVKLIRHRKKHN